MGIMEMSYQMFKNIFIGQSSKVIHAKEVYNTIRRCGKTTKKHLQTYLEIPLTTLNRTIDSLLTIGLIEEAGICESSLGRKPSYYKIKANSYYLIGIETNISGNKKYTQFNRDLL